MKLKAEIPDLRSRRCDLCGKTEPQLILTTPRLDGPLVRCRNCHLYYVVKTATTSFASPAQTDLPPSQNFQTSAQAAGEMRRLADRARQLQLVEPEIEEREKHWRAITAQERLAELRHFISNGRLLEIGCSTGEMLLAARQSFDVCGVEADEAAGQTARLCSLNCFSGTLEQAAYESEQFDVAALYHVIEHLPGPRATLEELHRILRPGGWLVLETPDISSLWVTLLGARWRQFIPDHIYFFTPQTISRLCQETGFQIQEMRSVGKAMSVRLFLSRLGRYHSALARGLSAISERCHLSDRTLRLNPGDVMRLYARKQ